MTTTFENACPRAADKIHQIDQRFNNGMKTEGVLEEDSDDQSELSLEQVGLKKRDVSIDPSVNAFELSYSSFFDPFYYH